MGRFKTESDIKRMCYNEKHKNKSNHQKLLKQLYASKFEFLEEITDSEHSLPKSNQDWIENQIEQ